MKNLQDYLVIHLNSSIYKKPKTIKILLFLKIFQSIIRMIKNQKFLLEITQHLPEIIYYNLMLFLKEVI